MVKTSQDIMKPIAAILDNVGIVAKALFYPCEYLHIYIFLNFFFYAQISIENIGMYMMCMFKSHMSILN